MSSPCRHIVLSLSLLLPSFPWNHQKFLAKIVFSPSAMKFPVQLAETKSSVCTFNRATLDWTERLEADKYVARPESLYGLGSEKNAREFLDVARSRLRHVDHALGHAVDLRYRGPTPLAARSIGMRKDRGGLPVAGRASFRHLQQGDVASDRDGWQPQFSVASRPRNQPLPNIPKAGRFLSAGLLFLGSAEGREASPDHSPTRSRRRWSSAVLMRTVTCSISERSRSSVSI
ncbi:hypothetical protein [Azospirillum sp. TSH64]|uniref:hypothetical protein n=1 Tax=Azospirillum sp. TSH64 TaxID=652740 RepID=UPI0011B2448E|nr:hypothetical protein [Azospirillum sp. TSH64]